jgi:predicted RNase H-like nuclease (RuvC/YqgF family)
MLEKPICMSGENMSNIKKGIIAGVDILPGYSVIASNKQPHYALVFLDKGSGRIIESYEDVSFARLLRLVWEYKPEIIAIDNVFELSRDLDGLTKLVNILPPNTKIVQVTGWGPEAVNIKSLAKKYGVETYSKLSPLKTAYLAALIASKGEGITLKLVEKKTRIIVSRGRSISHGGMSYDRYKRSVRAGIPNVTKTIKKILDQHGFDYDLVFRKSSGGLEKSIFTVYASRDKLYGLIKPFKNKSVRVIIKPVYTNKIVFNKNTETYRKGLILGIDPGISTGIAILDLDGNPLLTYSSKNLDRGEILNIVSPLGIVVIVATDVSHPPDLVKKIAATLNAQLYVPQKDLSSDEKHELINKIMEKYPWINIQDTHERDALVAAYKAYSSIADKIKQAMSKVDEIDLSLDREKIKIDIVRGKSIAEAIEEEISEKIFANLNKKYEDNRDNKQKNISEEDYLRRIDELVGEINRLKAYVNKLKNMIKEKDSIIENLVLELKYLKKNNEKISAEELNRRVYMLEIQNKELKKKLLEKDKVIEDLGKEMRQYKEVIHRLISENYVTIPLITKLTLSSLSKVNKYKMIFVKELYPLDNRVLEQLRRERIAIITDKDLGDLYRELRIPIIKTKNYIVFENYVLIPRDIIGKVEKIWRIIDEINMHEEYEKVLRLIKKYQEERKKKLGIDRLLPY